MKLKKFLNKKNWIQGDFALDRYDNPVSPLNPKAEKFCFVGAIQRCYSDRNERKRIYRKVNSELGYSSSNGNNHVMGKIVSWNDNDNTEFSGVKEIVNKLNI